jgi:hypothetical protein
MKARGKRERSERVSPGNETKCTPSPEGRDIAVFISALQASIALFELDPGATRFALAPGYDISRPWRC